MKKYQVRLTGVLIADVYAKDVAEAKELASDYWSTAADHFNATDGDMGEGIDFEYGFDGTECILDENGHEIDED
jgi:hypothetical protein